MRSPNNQANLQQGQTPQVFFVNINGGGKASAINYPVATGYEVFLLDEDSSMFFIKKNNGMGITLREFKYEEIIQEPQAQNMPTNFDPSNYVTKDDFNILLEKIDKLQEGKSRGHHYNNMRTNRRSRNGKSYDE